ncbi:hypothetical protein C4K22_1559 [Pseudomonas chlororaphis subsp. aurantiaca]|nr:hypothetical protein C4K22_1559 [Pseudomonas chlororaphis subsp. aurantiaca]AZD71927.1 hypothetical protein C4K16_1552 [Pseudomonas chlororaphis subsp. aurantiaca]
MLGGAEAKAAAGWPDGRNRLLAQSHKNQGIQENIRCYPATRANQARKTG